MSRSYRDSKGKRLNGEIWARDFFKVYRGKVYPLCGGEPWGGPKLKKHAKLRVSRLRRLEDKKIIKRNLSILQSFEDQIDNGF